MVYQGSLTEKDLFNDLLMSEKQVSTAYTVGITESSCSELRGVLNVCEQNVLSNQEMIFHVMSHRGWHKVKKAHAQDVESAKIKYNEIKNELI